MKKVPELPEVFTNVKPAYFTNNPNPPAVPSQLYPSPLSIKSHLREEYRWLEEVSLTQNVGDALNVTWAAHHATQKRSQLFDMRP